MKPHYFSKLLIGVLFILWGNHLYAQSGEQIVIHVEEGRSLSSYIASSKKNQISNLKVTGYLDHYDIEYLNYMAGRKRSSTSTDVGILETLDLSEAIIENEYLHFQDCDRLVSIKIPETAEHATFFRCVNLKHVNAENLIFDGNSSFVGCTSLEEVTLMKTTVVNHGFSDCTGLKYIHLENVSEYIQTYTFDGCTSLETISIGKNTTCSGENLGQSFIYDELVSIKEFIVSPENPRFCAKDGVLYSKDMTTLYKCPVTKSGDFYLPDETKIISYAGFAHCNKLTSFTAGKSLERIETQAFEYCKSLKYANLGNKLNYVASPFHECESLKEVHIDVPTPPKVNGEVIIDAEDYETVLFVPKGSYDAYWLARGWGDFKTIVEEGGSVPIAEITLNKEELTLDENETETLEATIVPELASDKTIVWKSEDETIASVDENGKVTALKAGETTITVSSSDGKVSASCKVTVKAVVIPVKSISLNKTEIELTEGSSFQLEATIDPENATDKNLTWTTSNKSVATVSENGLVSALKKGTASITVKTKDGKKSARCSVKVVAETIELESIALNKENVSLTVGSTETLTLSFTPENATHKEVTWSSSNEKIATVNQSGKITAKAAGETLISVETENGLKKTCRVTVTENTIPATSISLNFSELTLYVNDTESLVATLLPANATDKSVSWKSENPDVVSVDVEGNLKALKEGTSVITVQSDKYGLAATCKVTVISSIIKVTGITLNQEKANLQVGKSIQLKAEIRPENASNKEIKWSSSDEEIATVSADGKVTAVQPGDATITAETVDGNYKAECEISIAEVLIPIEEIHLETTEFSLELKQSFQLKVTVSPENQNEGDLIWSSSDEEVVVVDNNGKIEAVGTGTATITVSSSENKRIKATCRITVPREFEEDGISYKFEHDNSITILAYNETSVNVEIQESIEINGTIYSIIKIGNKAFANCTQLKKISIPASIERIEYNAFANCNLEEIHIESANPPYCNQSFSEQTLREAQVYVPEGSASAYRSALGWRDFENIIDGTTTGNEQLDVNQNTIHVSNGILMINAPSPTDVRIYDFSGILVKAESITGHQSIQLKEGLYILKIGNQTTKVLIK